MELSEFNADSNGMLEYVDYVNTIPKALDNQFAHFDNKQKKVFVPQMDSHIASLENILTKIEVVPSTVIKLENDGEVVAKEQERRDSFVEAKFQEFQSNAQALAFQTTESELGMKQVVKKRENVSRKLFKTKEEMLKCENLTSEISVVRNVIQILKGELEQISTGVENQTTLNMEAGENTNALVSRYDQAHVESKKLKRGIESFKKKVKI